LNDSWKLEAQLVGQRRLFQAIRRAFEEENRFYIRVWRKASRESIKRRRVEEMEGFRDDMLEVEKKALHLSSVEDIMQEDSKLKGLILIKQFVSRKKDRGISGNIRCWAFSTYATKAMREMNMFREQRDEAEEAMKSMRDMKKKQFHQHRIESQKGSKSYGLSTMRHVISRIKNQDLIRMVQTWTKKVCKRKHEYELGATRVLHKAALHRVETRESQVKAQGIVAGFLLLKAALTSETRVLLGVIFREWRGNLREVMAITKTMRGAEESATEDKRLLSAEEDKRLLEGIMRQNDESDTILREVRSSLGEHGTLIKEPDQQMISGEQVTSPKDTPYNSTSVSHSTSPRIGMTSWPSPKDDLSHPLSHLKMPLRTQDLFRDPSDDDSDDDMMVSMLEIPGVGVYTYS